MAPRLACAPEFQSGCRCQCCRRGDSLPAVEVDIGSAVGFTQKHADVLRRAIEIFRHVGLADAQLRPAFEYRSLRTKWNRNWQVPPLDPIQRRGRGCHRAGSRRPGIDTTALLCSSKWFTLMVSFVP